MVKLSKAKERALKESHSFITTKGMQWTDQELATGADCEFVQLYLRRQSGLKKFPPFKSLEVVELVDLPALKSLAGIENHAHLNEVKIDSALLALPKSWDLLAELPELTKLTIYATKVPLARGIEKLPNLFELVVENVKRLDRAFVESIPETVRSLDLGARLFDDGLAPITRLTRLERLHLFSRTNLIELPDEVYELASLTELTVQGNRFTTLSSKIRRLTSLKLLDVTRTALVTLPKELALLPKLRELAVSVDATKPPKELNGKLRKYTKGGWPGEDLKLAPIDAPDEDMDDVETLQLDDASRIPKSLATVKSLTLSFGDQRIPKLKQLATATKLVELLLRCDNVENVLPYIPRQITSLQIFDAPVDSLPELPNLTSLHVWNLTGSIDLAKFPKLDSVGFETTQPGIRIDNVHETDLTSLFVENCVVPVKDLYRLKTLEHASFRAIDDVACADYCQALAGNTLDTLTFTGKRLTTLPAAIGLVTTRRLIVDRTRLTNLISALTNNKALRQIIWPGGKPVDTNVLAGRWRAKKRANETTLDRTDG